MGRHLIPHCGPHGIRGVDSHKVLEAWIDLSDGAVPPIFRQRHHADHGGNELRDGLDAVDAVRVNLVGAVLGVFGLRRCVMVLELDEIRVM